jgi:hypothetical protein
MMDKVSLTASQAGPELYEYCTVVAACEVLFLEGIPQPQVAAWVFPSLERMIGVVPWIRAVDGNGGVAG